MSLRIRLLIGIVVLAASGLLVLDFVSYRVLEDHLDDRVEQQVTAAARPLEIVLRDRAGRGFEGAGQAGGFIPDGGPSSEPPIDGVRVPPRDGLPDQLPPGTFGQLRNASGKVLASVSFDLGDEKASRPDLGTDLPVTDIGEPSHPFTVDAREGDGRFRAAATRGPDGLVTVSAIPLGDNEETLDQLALVQGIVTVSVLAALAALAWWVIGIGLRPLRRMSETAGEIAEGDLSKRIENVDPKTEVGRLGISLNAMLAQIEEAFRQRGESEERMRRFLADASHELRTPLASIRGYSELHRLGAIEDAEERDRAMARIESESARMGNLVDDLLALARLDEMPEPARRPVALGTILEESAADVRVTAQDRRIDVDTGGDPVVEGDADQLRRMIVNLLRNAVVHTPDGTPVEVSAREADGEITITVRDHGSGLPAGSEEKVFDRFWRDSESRGRDAGGAGIGLAIVAAIVTGHGGTVSAANATEGQGAIFTVTLPAAP